MGAVELGHGTVVCSSGAPEQQRVALPAGIAEGRVFAFSDLVTFVHQPCAETAQLVVLVGSLASGLGGKRADRSTEGDIHRPCVLLKIQALLEHFSSPFFL